jgi:hypothetical protein
MDVRGQCSEIFWIKFVHKMIYYITTVMVTVAMVVIWNSTKKFSRSSIIMVRDLLQRLDAGYALKGLDQISTVFKCIPS